MNQGLNYNVNLIVNGQLVAAVPATTIALAGR